MEVTDKTKEHEYIDRQLDPNTLLARKSCFLFGPRQTGKSSLIKHSLKNVKIFDLLDNRLFLEFTQRPGRLMESLDKHDKLVVIDEIQRLPILLNDVHMLIEDRGIKFLLTGSSARSLRRKGVNLLGGRAATKYFHPLTSKELGEEFSLDRALSNGMIPSIYFSPDPKDDLETYCANYLQQEIIAEAMARDIPAFSRFLKVAALCNSTII